MVKLTKINSNVLLELLLQEYKDVQCELNFNNNYETLVSVILSAQCTDARVNMITPYLFKLASTPRQMLQLGEDKLKEIIKPCGFYNNKAKNIIKCSKQLIENFDGIVPTDISALQTLAGVGRKTASVVLAECYKIPTVPVDTHVKRVSNRLGLTKEKSPDKISDELMKLFPKEYWIRLHHSLIRHGRQVCKARKPNCEKCCLNKICSYYKGKYVCR